MIDGPGPRTLIISRMSVLYDQCMCVCGVLDVPSETDADDVRGKMTTTETVESKCDVHDVKPYH